MTPTWTICCTAYRSLFTPKALATPMSVFSQAFPLTKEQQVELSEMDQTPLKFLAQLRDASKVKQTPQQLSIPNS